MDYDRPLDQLIRVALEDEIRSRIVDRRFYRATGRTFSLPDWRVAERQNDLILRAELRVMRLAKRAAAKVPDSIAMAR